MTDLSTIAEKEIAAPKEALRVAGLAVTGGIAAVCNLGSRIFFSRIMRYERAVMAAYHYWNGCGLRPGAELRVSEE